MLGRSIAAPPSNKEMKRTKSALTPSAQPSPLISVFCGPQGTGGD